MASKTEICNLSLSFLGASQIVNISDNNAKAQVLRAEYEHVKRSELRKHTWRFAIKRDSLSALTSTPVSGPYTQEFELPTDCLKVLMAGDSWPGADMSDYRTGPSSDDYVIEGNRILSNLPAPLSLRYIYDVDDSGVFDSSFVVAFAAMLAWKTCERITQNTDKRRLAQNEYDEAVQAALRANAIEKPAEYPADSSWVLSRIAY